MVQEFDDYVFDKTCGSSGSRGRSGRKQLVGCGSYAGAKSPLMPRVVLRAPFRSNEVGAIGIVETQFGTHLVRVNERADKLDPSVQRVDGSPLF